MQGRYVELTDFSGRVIYWWVPDVPDVPDVPEKTESSNEVESKHQPEEAQTTTT